MPSPEFPSPIKNVKGSYNIKVQNKNIFNFKNANILRGYIYGSQMWISTAQTDRILYIKCKKNKTYTISRKVKSKTFRVATLDIDIPAETTKNTGYAIKNIITDDNANSITVTTDSNSKYLLVHYRKDICRYKFTRSFKEYTNRRKLRKYKFYRT